MNISIITALLTGGIVVCIEEIGRIIISSNRKITRELKSPVIELEAVIKSEEKE